MVNRREVMASGIALALIGRGAQAKAAAAGRETVEPERFVFIGDRRYAEAGAASRAAEIRGAEGLGVAADITPIYEYLDLELRTAPETAVAGLATPQALFAIERIAWDRGLRTVYRGRHRRGSAISHEFVGSGAIVAGIEAAPGHSWPEKLGLALAEAAVGPMDVSRPVTSQWLPQADSGVLVSWLLAPKARS